MQVETTRFGTLEISDEDVLTFNDGLLGFPEDKQFILIEHPGGPFQWLQSLETPGLAFPTLDPGWIFEDYPVELGDADLKHIGLPSSGGDIGVLAIVNVSEPTKPTINLLAPICLAAETRLGVQVVQHSRGLSARHPLVEDEAAEQSNVPKRRKVA